MHTKYTPLFTLVDRATRMSAISDEFDKRLPDFNEARRQYKENATVSLFQYAKDSIIASRVFIEETLVDEPVLVDLMRNLLNLYAGMIITAVGLNTVVTNSRTAKDILGFVSTESYQPSLDADQLVSDYVLGAKQQHLSPAKKAAIMGKNKNKGNNNNSNNVDPQFTKDIIEPLIASNGQGAELNVGSVNVKNSETTSFTGKTVKFDEKEGQLPCTRLLQLDLNYGRLTSKSNNTPVKDAILRMVITYTESVTNKKWSSLTKAEQREAYEALRAYNPSWPARYEDVLSSSNTQTLQTSDDNNVTVNVLVQLRPKFIPTSVSQAFIHLNFVPDFSKRYIQMTTGEISFFKDFLFSADIRNRRRKALLDDKTGILSEMLDAQANAMSKHFRKLAANSGNEVAKLLAGDHTNSVNIANTILVIDKRSFDQACSMAGIKFENPSIRAAFFAKTYIMILCVVDTAFGRIEMYYNGVTEGSHFSFRQMATNAKTETTDLINIMKNYANNTAPRF